jgi:hypothetical protein
MIPVTVSSTKHSDLVWLPSPATVSGRPASAWDMKAGIALPSLMRIRGP